MQFLNCQFLSFSHISKKTNDFKAKNCVANGYKKCPTKAKKPKTRTSNP